MTGRYTLIPGYKIAVSIKKLGINWHIDLNKQVSCLHDAPNTNPWETRQKHDATLRGNAGTDRRYSDREDCTIDIDIFWYEWLYIQISNMTWGLAVISWSGWIIAPKVLITHKISHINLHRRYVLYVKWYYSLRFVHIDVYMPNYVLRPDEAKLVSESCYISCYNFYIFAFTVWCSPDALPWVYRWARSALNWGNWPAISRYMQISILWRPIATLFTSSLTILASVRFLLVANTLNPWITGASLRLRVRVSKHKPNEGWQVT